MIEARELTRRYGPVVAVDGLSFAVQSGVVGFLGPNGAGKTTTLRMLTGALAMTSGTAIVAGYDVFEQPLEVKARVGSLPETPPLYPELTIGEYLSFVARVRGIPSSRRLSRVGEVMERVGLRGWERRRLGGLSKGYRQRVGLAQAIVHDPPLLLLDEPTSGLDPAQIVSVRALIRELASNRTVFLSTHVLSEVEALCQRVLLLHRGRLVGDGTVESLASGIGAGPWVELVLDDASEPPAAALAALGSVRHVTALEPIDVEGRTERPRWRMKLQGGEAVEPEVAALAAARGWRVRALVRHRPRLEEVFLALAGDER
jgi:ABC-2 type transport system ATP-binding protein